MSYSCNALGESIKFSSTNIFGKGRNVKKTDKHEKCSRARYFVIKNGGGHMGDTI